MAVAKRMTSGSIAIRVTLAAVGALAVHAGVRAALDLAASRRPPIPLAAPVLPPDEPQAAASSFQLQSCTLDADGDACTDVLLVSASESEVRIVALSIRRASPIWTASIEREFGCDRVRLEDVPDIDGDGVVDLACLQWNYGCVLHTLSGRTGELLHRAGGRSKRGAQTLALGMVQDSKAKQAFLATLDVDRGAVTCAVRELEGLTTVLECYTAPTKERSGDALTVVGDLDSDGREDVCLLVSRRDPQLSDVFVVCSTRGGMIGALDELDAWHEPATCQFGCAFESAGGRGACGNRLAMQALGIPGMTDCQQRVGVFDLASLRYAGELDLDHVPVDASVSMNVCDDMDGDGESDLLVTATRSPSAPTSIAAYSSASLRMLKRWESASVGDDYGRGIVRLPSVETSDGRRTAGVAATIGTQCGFATTALQVLEFPTMRHVGTIPLPRE